MKRIGCAVLALVAVGAVLNVPARAELWIYDEWGLPYDRENPTCCVVGLEDEPTFGSPWGKVGDVCPQCGGLGYALLAQLPDGSLVSLEAFLADEELMEAVLGWGQDGRQTAEAFPGGLALRPCPECSGVGYTKEPAAGSWDPSDPITDAFPPDLLNWW